MRKMIIMLALICIVSADISAQERKLTLTLSQQPLKELFKQI